MWFFVQIKILICIWNLKSVIRNETPLMKPIPVWRNSKVTGEGRAIHSLAMRLLQVLFTNYRIIHWEMQNLAKVTLGASNYFRKWKRKKIRICLYLLSMKRYTARSVTENSPQSKQDVGEGRHVAIQYGCPLSSYANLKSLLNIWLASSKSSRFKLNWEKI